MDTDKTTYDNAVQISDHVYWVGTYDDRDNFQCNPYLIKFNGKGVLIDPGSVLYFNDLVRKLTELIDLKDLTYIVIQHQDPDVCGNVSHLMEAINAAGNRQCKIITHRRTAALVRHYGENLKFEYSNNFKDKTVSLGDGRTLEFIHTPYLHAPGAIATYFNTDKILFSSDIFGGMTNKWSLYAGNEYFKEIKTFHEDYMPSKEILLFAMSQFEQYDIDKIAPQHGSIIGRKLARQMIQTFKDFECGLFIDQSFRDELQAARKKIEAQNHIMNRELNMAGQFQKALLPDLRKIRPDKCFDIAFLFEPYSQVSGDFLIIDKIDATHLGIMIIDVVDHGVTSGLATIQIKTLFDEYKKTSVSPAEVLKKINSKAFTVSKNDIFFTAIYMIYDCEKHRITIASAGGIPPVYYNAALNESNLISHNGTSLGLSDGDGLRVSDNTFSFGINDCLILQTDGLIDCINKNDESFDRVTSQKKFMQAIHKEKSAREILKDITDNVKRHRGKAKKCDDDATIVVFKRRENVS